MTYFYNVYQLVELFFNLLQGICRSVCDNCDTGDFLVLCNAYRKAVYIETPSCEKSRNSCEDACVVFYKY